MKPAIRKRLVGYLQEGYKVSQRRACRVIPISRKAMRYRSKRAQRDTALMARLKALGEQYPRYGYLMLHGLLKAEGLVVNRKRTYRLYTRLNLQVRTKRRKKLIRPRMPMMVPHQVNERWSVDFMSDQLADGRRFRILNLVDDYSRECVGQIVDTSISGVRLARYLHQLRFTRGLPRVLVCDNGTELTSKAMFFFSQKSGTRLQFIQPGKPTQNAFVESFNARFRDTCLNQHWFKDLEEARSVINRWRRHYNEVRPHSSLGYLSPTNYANQAA